MLRELVEKAKDLVFGKHKYANLLLRLLNWDPIGNPPRQRKGGSPNQDGEKRIVYLLWAIGEGLPGDIAEGLELCIEWFETQLDYGHMSGEPNWGNEAFITGHHRPIWDRIWAGMLRAIERLEARPRWRSDERFQRFRQLALDSIGGQLASDALCSTPDGNVVTLGTRFVMHTRPDPNLDLQRDALNRAVYGLPQLGDASRAAWWKTNTPASVGVTLLRGYLPVYFADVCAEARRGDFDALAVRLPRYRDEAVLERYERGHVIRDLDAFMAGFHQPNGYGTTVELAVAYYGPPLETVYAIHGQSLPTIDYSRLGAPVFVRKFPVVEA